MAIQDVKEPLLGRPILRALGLNTKEVLEAACDKFKVSVDANKLLPDEDYPEVSIARFLSSGIYHSNTSEKDEADSEIPEEK